MRTHIQTHICVLCTYVCYVIKCYYGRDNQFMQYIRTTHVKLTDYNGKSDHLVYANYKSINKICGCFFGFF